MKCTRNAIGPWQKIHSRLIGENKSWRLEARSKVAKPAGGGGVGGSGALPLSPPPHTSDSYNNVYIKFHFGVRRPIFWPSRRIGEGDIGRQINPPFGVLINLLCPYTTHSLHTDRQHWLALLSFQNPSRCVCVCVCVCVCAFCFRTHVQKLIITIHDARIFL